MEPDERLQVTEELLRHDGLDAEAARKVARAAVERGEPLLEFLCFSRLAVHLLAQIHSSSWVTYCGTHAESDGHEVVKRLLNSGASPDDLAIFARMMQQRYLSDLSCLLDGAGIFGTPELPCQEFRIFSVDDEGNPQAELEALHEQLGWTDLETERRLSREAEECFQAHVERVRRGC